MKTRRLMGVLIIILQASAMIVGSSGYGDVFIPLPIAVPSIFISLFITAYAASLIITDSFTALPSAIVNFFRK